ncbi:50S ribosomal protein L5 [Candidatus Roizmanbacteria bacterium RIFCSPLOWO2_01_FULL_42_14]|uniref:Large ribosomal subunit protein uL5 n=4 Tax=Candidatus Roizmaniibacteriota TaxID=1752723 RepID=A0A1F7JUY2_9BACT|nr:MAG: 50S ribosomal protein L5 [Candidatus Roizmanbacteria bacterium RIFCSPHIGHO2_02_FULL_43_11]OGK38605.1 MAG: 50S ribosomal protein L5 [Candidatus Roizmanbacteria bacterium RIFCSPHIGHO2_12_FULL_42_10]OGK52198.1 MAG: 50S ribosomal protein L5 [Candidatus Roizmanbacteria bacterium RIFCSPLOWO2_01_FULL_42_14]OGK59431.1 MAG: 50S ribosomal protein L5 [Candidatus Roizmanbacteria bacterium RIFCSPLOWO2_02_FULL_43_10]
MGTPLKKYYLGILKDLQKDLCTKNIHAVPRITKVVVNVGVGEAASNKNIIDKVVQDITHITGQKPVITTARKSISAFKIRKGLAIGVKVTLRGDNMYIFLDKLFKVVLPRIRDFRGIPETSLDKNGNLSIGVPDQTLFPEIDYDKIDKIRGLEITIVTSARISSDARKMFEKMGLVFMQKS